MNADRKPRRALGRGLDALLPVKQPGAVGGMGSRSGGVFTCPIERIAPRRDQPRRHFDGDGLDELATTIRQHGVIQPLVVRRLPDDDHYELIAGERRWRAAQRAGVKDVPIVVKDVSPEAAFELALIENLQRRDLNAMEVSEAYQRLLAEHAYTHEQLAERVGKSRSAVSNALRLMGLSDPVKALVADGSLSEGHARTLLSAPDEKSMLKMARQVVRERISVRKLELMLRRASGEDAPGPATPPAKEGKSASVRDLEARLTRRLSARTSVEHRAPGGQIVIRYADLDELDRIIAFLQA